MFSVLRIRLICISLMNTKKGIFTRGTRGAHEDTAFGAHSVKKNRSYTEKTKYSLSLHFVKHVNHTYI